MIGSRRRLGLLLAGACLALLAGWAFLIEPQRLQVRRLSLPLPGLQHPVKIFLLSDVDFPSSARRERKVLEAAAAFRPDVVLVAGDLLDRVENVRSAGIAKAAAAWVCRMGPRAYLAAGEEESPDSATLARWWEPLGLRLRSNQAIPLRIGDDVLDLFVADRRLDAPPWALMRDGTRPCAVQTGRFVHGTLQSREERDWMGTETTLAFRLGAPESYLDLHLGWMPGDGSSAREGFKVGRYEEEPAFRLAHGGRREATGFTPRVGVWTRARLRLAHEGDRTVFRARFWEEGLPEPTGWQGTLAVQDSKGPAPPIRGSFAVGSRRGSRAIADLRVTDLAGNVLQAETFTDAAAFRARWQDDSLLERWQATRDPSRPAILLAHHPDVVLDARQAGGTLPDLVLAGHTHGGQFRLPFVGPVWNSTQLGRHFDAGLFHVRGLPLYITAGVGTSIVPARFLAPPDVVCLTLQPADAVARNASLSTFPAAFRGMASRTWIATGTLAAARFAWHRRFRASGEGCCPGRAVTCATTTSPSTSSGRPTTAASSTAGSSRSTSSISRGLMRWAPDLIISRLRPTTQKKPSASRRPRSPVWKPAASSTSAVAAGSPQ